MLSVYFKNELISLCTMTWPSTGPTFENRWLIKAKEIFAPLRRAIIPWYKILDNCQVCKLGTPPTPLTNFTEMPAEINRHPLAAAPAKRVSSIWGRIYPNIDKVVTKHFKKIFRRLKEDQLIGCVFQHGAYHWNGRVWGWPVTSA